MVGNEGFEGDINNESLQPLFTSPSWKDEGEEVWDQLACNNMEHMENEERHHV